MKIKKELKYAEFCYDDKDKTFTITEEDGNRVILNKVYSFAFMRFVRILYFNVSLNSISHEILVPLPSSDF